MQEFRKKMATFLRDEDGISNIEYVTLFVLMVLGILVVVTTLTKKGK